jgi:hypothetical protein
MRLLIFFGVYEAERSFAHVCLEQLLDILRDHTVHVAIQDDASPSQLGDRLAEGVRPRLGDRVRVVRLERSLGFHGMYERVLGFLGRASTWGETFDYVLRVDPDLHFCSRRLADLFDGSHGSRLPEVGIVGPTLAMRRRDFALYLADLLPAGFRRRLNDGVMEHRWELARTRPVWWSDIGRQAVRNGFRGRIVSGAFQILSWRSVLEMKQRGWLSRPRERSGLVFQDDVVSATFVRALGHPLLDIREVLPTWSTELFLRPTATAAEVRRRGLDLVHALKNEPWAHALRQELILEPAEAVVATQA